MTETTTFADRMVISLMGITFFSVVVMNYIISPILPTIAREFQLSIGQAGQLVAIYSLLFAVSALALSFLNERFGLKRVMSLALSLFGVFTIMTAFAPTFRLMIVFRGISGLAAAVTQTACWAILANAIPYKRRGQAAGWVMQAGTAAILVGVPLGSFVSDWLGWQFIFLGVGGLALFVVLVLQYAIQIENSNGETKPVSQSFQMIFHLLKDPHPRAALAVSMLIWIAMFSFYTYLGAFLTEAFDLSTTRVGQTTLMLGIGYFFGGQIGGRLSDRIGREPVIIGGMIVMSASFLLLPQSPGNLVAAALVVILGFGFFFGYSAQVTTMTELVPEARSLGMAANYFVTYAGAAIGARIGGWIMESHGFAEVGVFAMLAAAAAGVIVLRLSIREIRQEEVHPGAS